MKPLPSSPAIGPGPFLAGSAFMMYFALFASGDVTPSAEQVAKEACEADAATLNTLFEKEFSPATAVCVKTDAGYIVETHEP